MLLIENIKMAFSSLKSNRLRAFITIFIIALGISAMVGILTAIDALKLSMTEGFSSMGSNTFTIRNRTLRVNFGGPRRKRVRNKEIDYSEATTFKKRYNFPATVSLSSRVSGTSTLKYKSNKTNPNIQVIASDENYLIAGGSNLEKGRNFSQNEVFSGSNVVIIGSEIRDKLFDKKENPVNKIISVGNGKYRVVGVLESKGSSMTGNTDRAVIIPINNARSFFGSANTNYVLSVIVSDQDKMNQAIAEAEGVFRIIRRVKLTEADNFGIIKSDSLSQQLIENLSFISVAAIIICLLTLISAAISLMNIMLVTVTERTREIGIRKALGANQKTIRQQFLFEALSIGQLGGLFGIVLGIIFGNLVSLVIGGGFIIPWNWVIGGVLLCLIVGLVSGFYPAAKAAKLDPIESLRYE